MCFWCIFWFFFKFINNRNRTEKFILKTETAVNWITIKKWKSSKAFLFSSVQPCWTTKAQPTQLFPRIIISKLEIMIVGSLPKLLSNLLTKTQEMRRSTFWQAISLGKTIEMSRLIWPPLSPNLKLPPANMQFNFSCPQNGLSTLSPSQMTAESHWRPSLLEN